MDELGKKLEMGDNLGGWYKVSNKTLIENGGKALLYHHNSSLFQILKSVYPDFPWDPLKFPQAPRNHWTSIENQKLFMDELAKKLGINLEGKEVELAKEMEKWYKVSSRQLISNGGKAIFAHHKNSLFEILRSVYPIYQWDPLKFSKAPQNYWSSLSNQRAFMDELGKKLGVKMVPVPGESGRLELDISPWYKVTKQYVRNQGGGGILDVYKGSVPSLLTAVYPEIKFDMWRFNRSARKLKKSDNVKDLGDMLSYIASELNISEPEQWKRISADQLKAIGISRTFQKRATLMEALTKEIPSTKLEKGSDS